MNNGIIAVVSSGRDGSSLMMQTLKILGVPIAAKPFIKEHDKIRQYNPNGFYEIAGLDDGIHDERFSGQAVKLFPLALKNTPINLIRKIIRTTRNPIDAAISYCPIKEILEDTELSAFEIIEYNNKFLDDYLIDHEHILIKFDAIIENPLNCIEQIVDYLEIQPSLSQINEAVKNVDVVEKLKS